MISKASSTPAFGSNGPEAADKRSQEEGDAHLDESLDLVKDHRLYT